MKMIFITFVFPSYFGSFGRYQNAVNIWNILFFSVLVSMVFPSTVKQKNANFSSWKKKNLTINFDFTHNARLFITFVW